jgi:hypothetical protein
VYVSKQDATTLQYTWVKLCQGGAGSLVGLSIGHSVAVDPTGVDTGVYVTGTMGGPISSVVLAFGTDVFNPASASKDGVWIERTGDCATGVTTSANGEGVVVKMAQSDGSAIWAEKVGGHFHERIQGCVVDPNTKQLYVVGRFLAGPASTIQKFSVGRTCDSTCGTPASSKCLGTNLPGASEQWKGFVGKLRLTTGEWLNAQVSV